MPAYQIHRLKETARLQFRNAPHTSGATVVKAKDYEGGAKIEAASPYAAWMALRESSDALQVGDLLETEGGGELRIFKYIGFEEARWYVLEPAPTTDSAAIAVT
jgi:hypothetical protein